MSESPVTSQDQLSRIRKLLEKAEAEGVTPQEAEALRERAYALAAKYEIDVAVARASGTALEDRLTGRTFDVGRPYLFQVRLAYIVYTNNGCELIQLIGTENGKKLRGRVNVVGFESDLARADLLFTSLVLQAAHEAVNGYRKYLRDFEPTECETCGRTSFREIPQDTWLRCARCGFELDAEFVHTKPDRRSTWYRSFWNGWIHAIAPRIEAARAVAKVEADVAGTGAEIALRSRDLAVKERFDRIYPDRKAGRRSRGTSGSGYDSGKEAGRRADIGNGRLGAKRGELGR